MDAAIERRLTVAVSWALARSATLDSLENYEASYALSEEFREWLLCLEEHPELLETTVLMVPNNLGEEHKAAGRRLDILPPKDCPPKSEGLLEDLGQST